MVVVGNSGGDGSGCAVVAVATAVSGGGWRVTAGAYCGWQQ